MSSDVEKLDRIRYELAEAQRRRTSELGPAEKIPSAVLRKWADEQEAFQIYLDMFRDMHGASIVLLNALVLSIHVVDRHLPPMNMGNICLYMPGKAPALTFRKTLGDGSIPRIWSFAIEPLGATERAQVKDGLDITERLADSFKELCSRVMKVENWKR